MSGGRNSFCSLFSTYVNSIIVADSLEMIAADHFLLYVIVYIYPFKTVPTKMRFGIIYTRLANGIVAV